MDDPGAGLQGSIAERREARVRGRSRTRRRRALGWGLRALVLLVVLFVGISVGRAIEEAPRPGGTQTRVRTFEPGTVPPVTRTVTVTTDGS